MYIKIQFKRDVKQKTNTHPEVVLSKIIEKATQRLKNNYRKPFDLV